MSVVQKLSLMVCTGFLLASLGGCAREGPAERAGKQIDETVEELTNPEGPAESAGEEIDRSVDEAREELEGQ
jgi:hypothetical protein